MENSNKLLLPIALIIGSVIMLAVIGMSRTNRPADETSDSTEESSSLSEIIIVPSEMPDRITFQLPAGFTETASDYYDLYYVRDDASVIVTGEDLKTYGIDADTYTEGVKKQYEQTAEGFHLISEEKLTLDGAACNLLEFTYDIVGAERTQSMECTTAVLIKDEFVYIITCKSHKDTYMNYRGAFRQMIDTVRIGEAQPETTAVTEGIPAPEASVSETAAS